MNITFIHSDILEVAANHLLSSGNVMLNMSGGVNGALLERYGIALQKELHAHLKSLGLKNVTPGYCYKFQGKIGHYKTVVYGVGIDGWYDSSIELICKTLNSAFEMMNPVPNDVIAIPAIGTGYGHLDKRQFGAALHMIKDQWDLDCLVVERSESGLNEIVDGFKGCG